MTKQEERLKKIMTFMSFDSKVDTCISPNNNYSKNTVKILHGWPIRCKKKNVKNVAESTLKGS